MSISNQPSKELAKNFQEDVGLFLQASAENSFYKPILEKEKRGLLIDFFYEMMGKNMVGKEELEKTLYDMLDDMEELELIGDVRVGLFDMLAQSETAEESEGEEVVSSLTEEEKEKLSSLKTQMDEMVRRAARLKKDIQERMRKRQQKRIR